MKKTPAQGWQCPVCGSVYAPHISECSKVHGQVSSTSTDGYILAYGWLYPGEIVHPPTWRWSPYMIDYTSE